MTTDFLSLSPPVLLFVQVFLRHGWCWLGSINNEIKFKYQSWWESREWKCRLSHCSILSTWPNLCVLGSWVGEWYIGLKPLENLKFRTDFPSRLTLRLPLRDDFRVPKGLRVQKRPLSGNSPRPKMSPLESCSFGLRFCYKNANIVHLLHSFQGEERVNTGSRRQVDCRGRQSTPLRGRRFGEVG